MNAKELTAAIIRNLTKTVDCSSASAAVLENITDPALNTPSMKHLLCLVNLNSQKIWLQRTHNVSESIHLNAPPHVYREMFVPFNAVRAGLKKHGFDPDSIGLTECYLLQGAIDDATYRARQKVEGCDVKYSASHARHDLERLLVTLKAIGISESAAEVLKIKELQIKIDVIEKKFSGHELLIRVYELEPEIREVVRTNGGVYRGHMFNWHTPAGEGWEGEPLQFTDGVWLTPYGVSFTTVADYLAGWHCHYAACHRIFRQFGASDPLKNNSPQQKAGEEKLEVLREFVRLVDESLSLRKLAEEDRITRGQEQRLIGVVAYIYRSNEEMVKTLSSLHPSKREEVLGGLSTFAFRIKMNEAGQRYTTMAEKTAKEKAAEEEKLAQEELELWRKVAQVECRHRYGHENYVVNSDWNGDGHFYSSVDQMEWGIPPEDKGPGVLVLKSGEQHCLCHWHKLSDDRFIPRKYSAPQAA